MNIVMFGMDQLGQLQRNREAAFYSFLFQQSAGQNPNNEVHFTKFLKDQFTSFPIGRGYPIISKSCDKPSCYFYVNVQQARDFYHDFFKFLNREIEYLQCSCKKIIKRSDQFIYDSPLAGFLQLKLTERDFLKLKTIQITKNHEVYLEDRGPFQEAFNCARLSAITEIGKELRTKKEDSQTLRVNTFSIINEIQERIIDLPMFKGQYKPSQDILQSEMKKNNVLPIISTKSARPLVYLYKQIEYQHKLITIPLEIKDKLAQKYLEYYDFELLSYYYLGIDGVLFKCDFRYMYNFSSNSYQLAKLCTLEGLPPMQKLTKDHSKLIIKSGKIYIFSSLEKDAFIQIFKAPLPQSYDERPLKMEIILKNTAHYRRGFSVTWVRSGLLIKQECIIIFGGVIQRVKNFKLLEIVVLSAQEKYLYHMVPVKEEDFAKVSLLSPNVSVFASRLMMVGGYDVITQKYNRNAVFLPLKERLPVMVQPITIGDTGKQDMGDKLAMESIHISEGTLIYGRLTKQSKPFILRFKSVKNGYVQIDNIRLF